MVPSTTRRPSWRTVTPVLAVAVFGLAACSNSQESSDVEGTNPPVWTGSQEPAGHGEGGHEQGGGEEDAPADAMSAELKNPDGKVVATATIATSGDHVEIMIDAQGLEPGFHGVHIHQVGKCEPNSVAPDGGEPGNFLSAGGHLQVGDPNAHPSSGDLTSLFVAKDGTGTLLTTTDNLTVNDLKVDGGRALMIHAGADNFGNIPERYSAGGPDEKTLKTGDAGGRVACGVVE